MKKLKTKYWSDYVTPVVEPRSARFTTGQAKHMKYETKKWSQNVTERSNALDLESGVFTWSDPKKIAASLKWSAETSSRRKARPFQSAMSMLNFYINRAGKNLKPDRKKILEKAKIELRKTFSRCYRKSSCPLLVWMIF